MPLTLERLTAIQIAIGLPVLLNGTCQILEESDIDRAVGRRPEGHGSLLRCSVPFLYIALITRCYQIFPAIFPSPAAWQDVVQGNIGLLAAALPGQLVPPHHIPSGQRDTAVHLETDS